MLTANILAGYTMAMADGLRKAMGKKKMDVMAKHRQIFPDGAVERGVDAKVAADIFETMEKFAAYGFNKIPLRRVRYRELPHRVSQGELPRGVYGRGDDLGAFEFGKGVVLREGVYQLRDRGDAALRERIGGRLRCGLGGHSLGIGGRAERGKKRRGEYPGDSG